MSYDRFYPNADRLFRVLERHYSEGKLEMSARTTYPLARALKEEYPEIEHSSRYQNFWQTFFRDDKTVEGTLATVDRDFFDMFGLVFVKGYAETAFTGPHDIVITEDMASRYFGDEDPIGKSMNNGPDHVFTVTGVIRNFPRNSHFYIDCLVSSEFLKSIIPEDLNDWKVASAYTFVELKEGTDSRKVEEKIRDIIKGKVDESNSEIFLQNIKRTHLYSRGIYSGDLGAGNITQVRLAMLVALLILSIACINFMNLFTARSAGRAKEIGIRKISGARRRTIVFQFLGESLLIILIAQVVAMILVELILPFFNIVMFTNLKVGYQSAGIYLILISMILFCGLLAGSYPALYMSSLQPVNTLRGNIIKAAGKAGFRRMLVISQFTLSFMFIISTFIIKSQVGYMNSESFGADIKDICYFEFNEEINRETLKNELGKIPGVSGITMTEHQYVLNNWSTAHGIAWKGKKEGQDVNFAVLFTDRDYANAFRLKLKSGSYFAADEFSIDNSAVVINEKAAEILGFPDPVGETLTSLDGKRFTITGVLKDFHFKSFRFPIDPLLIVPIHSTQKGGNCFIRMNPDSVASTLTEIRNKIKSAYPGYPVKIGFLEDEYNNLNRIESISGTMFGYLTFLAIIISVLGLLGLSTYMIVRRTKEIGIRKVHGAEAGEIFAMLSIEYIWLVTISFLIASPVSWFAVNIWLRGYAYHITISLWLFAMAWMTVMAVTLLTVGLQLYRACYKNPVDALRYE